jgi:hypothetical protein
MADHAVLVRLQTLKDSAAQADQSTLDKEARAQFMLPVWNYLRDAEYALSQGQKAPNPANAAMWLGRVDLQLRSAERLLKKMQDMLSE